MKNKEFLLIFDAFSCCCGPVRGRQHPRPPLGFPGINFNHSPWTDFDFKGWTGRRWVWVGVAVTNSEGTSATFERKSENLTSLRSPSTLARFRTSVKGCGVDLPTLPSLCCDILNVCVCISLHRGHRSPGKLLIFAHRTHCRVALLKPVTRKTFCSLCSFLRSLCPPLWKLEIDIMGWKEMKQTRCRSLAVVPIKTNVSFSPPIYNLLRRAECGFKRFFFFFPSVVLLAGHPSGTLILPSPWMPCPVNLFLL